MRFIYIFLFIHLLQSLAFASSDITVCVVPNNAPFAFIDSDDELKGFDLDILEKMQLPYTVTLHRSDVAASFAALDNAQCDMLLSNITITNSRSRWFLFSTSHLSANLHALVLKESPIEDTANLQYGIIGVVKGSEAEDYAFEHYKSSIIYALSDAKTLVDMLNEGVIEAIIDSLPELHYLVKENKNLRILEQEIAERNYGYVFDKDRNDLRDVVSSAINKLKEDKEIDGIYTKWFTNTTNDNEHIKEDLNNNLE